MGVTRGKRGTITLLPPMARLVSGVFVVLVTYDDHPEIRRLLAVCTSVERAKREIVRDPSAVAWQGHPSGSLWAVIDGAIYDIEERDLLTDDDGRIA